MIKKIMIFAALLFCFNLPAWAGGGPGGNDPVAALTGNLWNYSGYVYDPLTSTAGWYIGEVKFNPDYTVEIRNINDSGNFGPTNITTLRYSINNSGTIDIMDPSNAYPYIGGQLSRGQDKISAVLTVNNSQNNLPDPSPGNVLFVRESTVSFNNYDLTGQWSGSVFINNSSTNNSTPIIGWLTFNMTIDTKGNVTGTSLRYDGNTGSFSSPSTSPATISPSGNVTIIIANTQDPTSPIKISGQMDSKRGDVSFDFIATQPGQTSLGVGVMVKNIGE